MDIGKMLREHPLEFGAMPSSELPRQHPEEDPVKASGSGEFHFDTALLGTILLRATLTNSLRRSVSSASTPSPFSVIRK